MGLEADPCWLKWWCKFPAAGESRAEDTLMDKHSRDTESRVSSKHLCQVRQSSRTGERQEREGEGDSERERETDRERTGKKKRGIFPRN